MPAVDAVYIVAWVLPALIGAGLWTALTPVRRVGDLCAAIGAGWIVGLFIAAGCARVFAPADTAHAFAHAWPWCAAIGVLAWIVAAVRRRRSQTAWPVRPPAEARALRIVWWLLLAWLVARFVVIGDEASLRPVFPWDAWSAWSIKPKTWFLTGYLEPYVSMQEWLSRPDFALRTAASWRYPELLAWMQLWFAGAAGAWNEPLVDVAWCGALVAFSLAAYGYWRVLGLAPWLALLLVYGLASLPLIDAHVALAGYADLWLALALGVATLAWTRWLITRDRGQLVLAAALALCLPMIKLEGMVWLIVLGAVALWDFVTPRLRWLVAPCLLAACIVGFLLISAGSARISWNAVAIPSLGTFSLAWHGVGGAILESLFTLPNWHLFWYLVPILLIVRRRRFRVDRAARLLGAVLLIDFALLFVLFFLTTASAWAQDFTSANRLILQLVPSVFVLAAVLLRPMAADEISRDAPSRNRATASVPPTARA